MGRRKTQGPMARSALALGVLTLLLCLGGAAHAQRTIYKSVGPDGSITFTDRPPPGQQPPAAKAPLVITPAPAASGAQSAGSTAKKATRKAAEPPAAAASAPTPQLDPAMEKAALALLSLESIISEFVELCTATLPTSSKTYLGAADQWRQRHSGLMARQQAVLRDHFSPAEQAGVRSGAKNKTRGMMAPVFAAATARKIKWCDDNAVEIATGKVDLSAPNASQLMAYQGRR